MLLPHVRHIFFHNFCGQSRLRAAHKHTTESRLVPSVRLIPLIISERLLRRLLTFEIGTLHIQLNIGTIDRLCSLVTAHHCSQSQLGERKNEQDNRDLELMTLRENLDKQVQIVQKKKEDLDKANEERIKALEKVAALTQQEARDQLLDQVRAKSESEALSIVRDAVTQAKLNASKEAKKIVIQTIQRMAAEFTIENTFGLQVRNDAIENGLYQTQARQRVDNTAQDVQRSDFSGGSRGRGGRSHAKNESKEQVWGICPSWQSSAA